MDGAHNDGAAKRINRPDDHMTEDAEMDSASSLSNRHERRMAVLAVAASHFERIRQLPDTSVTEWIDHHIEYPVQTYAELDKSDNGYRMFERRHAWRWPSSVASR
jgi:hypothetical protein